MRDIHKGYLSLEDADNGESNFATELTLLGPQAPWNSFLRFFSGSFVFDIKYEKLWLIFFTPVTSFLESSGTMMSLWSLTVIFHK